MDPRRDTFLIIRKVAMVTLVVAVAFSCGWSAGGFTSGAVFAIALGTAGALAVFRSRPAGGCFPRRRSR